MHFMSKKSMIGFKMSSSIEVQYKMSKLTPPRMNYFDQLYASNVSICIFLKETRDNIKSISIPFGF